MIGQPAVIHHVELGFSTVSFSLGPDDTPEQAAFELRHVYATARAAGIVGDELGRPDIAIAPYGALIVILKCALPSKEYLDAIPDDDHTLDLSTGDIEMRPDLSSARRAMEQRIEDLHDHGPNPN